MNKYYDKQRQIETIKQSNRVKNIYSGSAIYLPRRIYKKENVFSDIFNFIAINKEPISNVASASCFVADSVGKIGNTTLDTIKKIHKLQQLEITDNAMNKVINASDTTNSRNTFFKV